MPLTPPNRRLPVLLIPLLALLPALFSPLGGCGRVFSASGIKFDSIDNHTAFSPSIVSSAYRAADTSTAEIYLSDIPLRDLARAESLDELSGTIVHIHLFIRPRPGKTPIEPTASTAIIQAAVLARGEVGLYGGGGFMLPSGVPGDNNFGGSIRGGSVRLLSATPGFADRLGAAGLTAGVRAPLDATAAAVMAHLFEQAGRVARGEATASDR
jgi:hypothetical protein